MIHGIYSLKRFWRWNKSLLCEKSVYIVGRSRLFGACENVNEQVSSHGAQCGHAGAENARAERKAVESIGFKRVHERADTVAFAFVRNRFGQEIQEAKVHFQKAPARI